MKSLKKFIINRNFLFCVLTICTLTTILITKKNIAEVDKQNQILEEKHQIINENKNEISSLNTQVSSYEMEISLLLSKVQTLEQQITELEDKNKIIVDSYENKISEIDLLKKQRRISLLSGDFIKTPTYKDLYKMDLRTPSLATINDIDKFLKGTKLEGLGYFYKYCEVEYGVNAVFLASLSILESGWGNTRIAVQKNNIFSWMAYDNSAFSSAKTFKSYSDCILTVVPQIVKNYLTDDGIYHNGYTISAMNEKYASDSKWTDKIINIMLKFDESRLG